MGGFAAWAAPGFGETRPILETETALLALGGIDDQAISPSLGGFGDVRQMRQNLLLRDAHLVRERSSVQGVASLYITQLLADGGVDGNLSP